MAKATFDSIVDSEIPVLLDFYATWCGPCKMFAPTLNTLKEDLQDDVKIYKIDIDKNQELANSLGIMSVPTVMIYKNGEVKWQATGAQSLSELKKQLKSVA